MMTRSVRVLDRDEKQPEDLVTFSSPSQDDEPDSVHCAVTVTRADYDQFGRPEQITVTIEPGDKLNT